jgi:hypothetical protein
MPKDIHLLHTQLRACENRLGTRDERPTDFEEVLKLAHEINNQLTAEMLREALECGLEQPECRPQIIRRLLG